MKLELDIQECVICAVVMLVIAGFLAASNLAGCVVPDEPEEQSK